jgi:hypothetical protein
MASFTERATLEVKDRSTAQIRKINAELKRLQATANSLRSIKIELTGIALARRQVQGLIRDLRALRALTASVKVSSAGVAAAQRQVAALRRTAARPINIKVNYTSGRPPIIPRVPGGGVTPPGGGGGRGGRGYRGRTFVGTALQGVNAGVGGGLGFGLLGGLGAVNPAFIAVAAAAYAAAAALRNVGEATVKADRANLMMKLAATPEQQKIITDTIKDYVTSPHPLAMSRAEMQMFITGMLGDVGGKTAAERATAAANIAPQIADKYLALTYGMGGPDVSKEEALKGLNTLVKALNLASGDLTDASGRFTKDGERVFEGVLLAKAMNPLLEADRIRTTLANLKTAAFTMDKESLGSLLALSGDRGVRVANEVYQAIRSMSGTIDNKGLNKALEGLGLLKDAEHKKSGAVVPGTGTPVDSVLLRQNPFEWVIKNVLPKLSELAARPLTAREKAAQDVAAKRIEDSGGTAEEVAAAREPGFARLQGILDKMFPGMQATAKTALAEILFNREQRKATLDQGKQVLDQLKEPGAAQKIFSESLAASWQNLKTTLETRSAELGQTAADAVGLTAKINDLEAAIRGPGPERDRVMGWVNTVNQVIDPFRIATQLLSEAGRYLFVAAQAIASYFGKTLPNLSPTQSAIAAAAGDPEKRRSLLQDEIARMERDLAQTQARHDRAVAVTQKDRAAREITIQSAAIEAKKAELAALPAPSRRTYDPMFRPEPKPAGADPWAGAKVPTQGELQTMMNQIGVNAATWSEIILKGPTAFEQVFNTLPEKSGAAGTSMGTTAIDTINGGAPGAGASMGTSFLDTVRGGLAGLNLNFTATVAGQPGKGTDTGARTGD